jgi:histone H3/H4
MCDTFLTDLVSNILVFVKHQRRKTVMGDDVSHAAERMKVKRVYFHDQPDSHCKPYVSSNIRVAKRGAGSIARIKWEQRQSACTYFQRAPLERLIKMKTAEENKTNEPFRWSSTALDRVQILVEAHLVQIFELANVCAIHAKRVSVKGEDLQLVVRMFEEVPCVQVK